MPEQRNLILAIVLSVTIILAFQYFYELPRMKETQHQSAQRTEQTAPAPATERGQGQGQAGAPVAPATATPGVEAVPQGQTRAEVLASSQRLAIDGDRVRGSLALAGGRIDDLTLSDYHETTNPGSPAVTLLNPPGAPATYFAEFGWVPADKSTRCPARDTVWQADGGVLTHRPAGDAHLGQRRRA